MKNTDTIQRIRVVLVIDVERSVIDAEYGTVHTMRDIRDMVEGAAQSATQSELSIIGARVKVAEARR